MQLENSHSGMAGRSLVNVIQDSLDQGIIDWQEAQKVAIEDSDDYKICQLQGYVAGMAKALGIIRGTSVKTEINESKQRISERGTKTTDLIGSIGSTSTIDRTV
jgi:hypothetical protein